MFCWYVQLQEDAGVVLERDDDDDGDMGRNIAECFEHLEGFLMPHPGKNVQRRQFQGQWKGKFYYECGSITG